MRNTGRRLRFITNPRLGGPHRWWGPVRKERPPNYQLAFSSADVMWVGGDVTRILSWQLSRAAVCDNCQFTGRVAAPLFFEERCNLALVFRATPSLSSVSFCFVQSSRSCSPAPPHFFSGEWQRIGFRSSLEPACGAVVCWFAELQLRRRFIAGSCMHYYRWPGIRAEDDLYFSKNYLPGLPGYRLY